MNKDSGGFHLSYILVYVSVYQTYSICKYLTVRATYEALIEMCVQ